MVCEKWARTRGPFLVQHFCFLIQLVNCIVILQDANWCLISVSVQNECPLLFCSNFGKREGCLLFLCHVFHHYLTFIQRRCLKWMGNAWFINDVRLPSTLDSTDCDLEVEGCSSVKSRGQQVTHSSCKATKEKTNANTILHFLFRCILF